MPSRRASSKAKTKGHPHAQYPCISHSRSEETLEAKARWFRTLSPEKRLEYACAIMDLVRENNPKLLKAQNVRGIPGRVCVLTLP